MLHSAICHATELYHLKMKMSQPTMTYCHRKSIDIDMFSSKIEHISTSCKQGFTRITPAFMYHVVQAHG